jgi:hypothetical protein
VRIETRVRTDVRTMKITENDEYPALSELAFFISGVFVLAVVDDADEELGVLEAGARPAFMMTGEGAELLPLPLPLDWSNAVSSSPRVSHRRRNTFSSES